MRYKTTIVRWCLNTNAKFQWSVHRRRYSVQIMSTTGRNLLPGNFKRSQIKCNNKHQGTISLWHLAERRKFLRVLENKILVDSPCVALENLRIAFPGISSLAIIYTIWFKRKKRRKIVRTQFKFFSVTITAHKYDDFPWI